MVRPPRYVLKAWEPSQHVYMRNLKKEMDLYRMYLTERNHQSHETDPRMESSQEKKPGKPENSWRGNVLAQNHLETDEKNQPKTRVHCRSVMFPCAPV